MMFTYKGLSNKCPKCTRGVLSHLRSGKGKKVAHCLLCKSWFISQREERINEFK